MEMVEESRKMMSRWVEMFFDPLERARRRDKTGEHDSQVLVKRPRGVSRTGRRVTRRFQEAARWSGDGVGGDQDGWVRT